MYGDEPEKKKTMGGGVEKQKGSRNVGGTRFSLIPHYNNCILITTKNSIRDTMHNIP
jgi:hypothetical protein